MTAVGKTSISDGFEAARQLFKDSRPSATKVVLLLSDGEQNVDAAPDKTPLQTAIDAAALAKGEGVTVFAWGFGENLSQRASGRCLHCLSAHVASSSTGADAIAAATLAAATVAVAVAPAATAAIAASIGFPIGSPIGPPIVHVLCGAQGYGGAPCCGHPGPSPVCRNDAALVTARATPVVTAEPSAVAQPTATVSVAASAVAQPAAALA
eukprot:scaffold71663_cov94-Phaeocystis_antarctica.AAC.1